MGFEVGGRLCKTKEQFLKDGGKARNRIIMNIILVLKLLCGPQLKGY